MKLAFAICSFVFGLTSGCKSQTSKVVVAPTPPGGYVVSTPKPSRSLAVSSYTGTETSPVTLSPKVQVTTAQLMTGVNKSTLLIIIRNQSGHLLTDRTQLLLDSTDLTNGGYYGKGPLFPGERRIIKVHNLPPAWVTLVWRRRGTPKQGFPNYTGGRWKSKNPVQSGRPLILTVLPNDKLRVTRTLTAL